MFDYADLINATGIKRSWGAARIPTRTTDGVRRSSENKGTLKVSVMSYDFIPAKGERVHKDVTYELEQFPEDKTEKDLEKHRAAVRAPQDFSRRRSDARSSRSPMLSKSIYFYQKTHSANIAMKLNRTLTWDAAHQRVAGDEEANRSLARLYRGPWVHPSTSKV